jgi:hypothetical protein
MSKFYFIRNVNQVGPFTAEELIEQGFTRESLIWTEGMEAWEKADLVPAVEGIIKQLPPPLQPKQTLYRQQLNAEPQFNLPKPVLAASPPKAQRKRSYFFNLLAGVAIILLLINIALMGYRFVPTSQAAERIAKPISLIKEMPVAPVVIPPEEMEELKQKELQQPLNYLNAELKYNWDENDEKMILEGKINNAATLAAYSDVLLEFVFQNEKGRILSTKSARVHEYISPGNFQKFKFKFTASPNVDVVSCTVKRAKPGSI